MNLKFSDKGATRKTFTNIEDSVSLKGCPRRVFQIVLQMHQKTYWLTWKLAQEILNFNICIYVSSLKEYL